MRKRANTKKMVELEAAADRVRREMLERARPVLRAQAAELKAGTCSETLKILAADLNDWLAKKYGELEALAAAWRDERDRAEGKASPAIQPSAPAIAAAPAAAPAATTTEAK